MQQATLRLEGAALSDPGYVRKNNEDSYLFDHELQLYAVADGMGGHEGGEVASRMAVEGLARAARNGLPDQEFLQDHSLAGRQQILDWLTRTIDEINLELQAEVSRQPELRGMGCTLDVVLFRANGVFIAHVGDSRVYLRREQHLYQLTEDHTIGQMMVANGLLTAEQAERHPQRHVLTRALGPIPKVEIDTSYFEVGDGDVFLLCSDGLHGDVAFDHIRGALAQPPEHAVRDMMSVALAAGGRDNITGLVVSVAQCETEQPMIIGSQGAQEAMARSTLFAGFTWRELVRVQKIAIGRLFAPGEYLMEQGRMCDFLLLNIEGQHTIWRDSAQIGAGGPGDPVGELSMVSQPGAVTVRAETPVTVLEFPLERLRGLLATEPELAAKLAMAALARVSQRLRGVADSLARYRKVYGPTPLV